jgi:hypothetical protein
MSRSLAYIALGVAGAAMAGMALATGAWRLGLGLVAVAAAGVFGGLLDGEGRAPRRTILLLGLLTYLVLVPALGFLAHGLEELGGPSPPEGLVLMSAALWLGGTFFGARHWRLHARPRPRPRATRRASATAAISR